MLEHIANWASIFGFLITIGTLLMALNIRGKIEHSLGRQRFLQQRGQIVADFAAVRAKVKGAEETDGEVLEELRVLLLSLTHYKIWHFKERMHLDKFIAFISLVYSGQKRTTSNDLVMRIDEAVAIVKSQVEV